MMPTEKQRTARKKKLFDGIVDQLLSLHFDGMPTQPNFAFICDREQDLHPQFLQWMERLYRQGKPEYHRIVGLCLMSSQAVASVQAADLIAYVMREHVESIGENRMADPLIARLILAVGDGATPLVTHFVPARLTGADLSLWEIVQALKRGGGQGA
jgi:hypothetical protein